MNPTNKSDVSEAMAAARLIQAGYQVLKPVLVSRYDLMTETPTGQLRRVQVKTGRLKAGAVEVRSVSVNYRSRNSAAKVSSSTYEGQVDDFAVYCPQNDEIYIVPMAVIGRRKQFSLRVTPTLSGRKDGCREAEAYRLVRPSVVGPGMGDVKDVHPLASNPE